MSEPSDSQLNTKEHPDLYRKSIKGGYWVIALRAAIMLLGFAKTLVIANFFYLENLGIISIAIMMMDILSMFTQTGFDVALVQKKENIHSYLNTAWAAGLMKGIALFLILYFFAPLLASIRVPEDKFSLAVSILRAMSFCFLIRGVQNIGIIYFRKELEFRKVFSMTFAASLADIVFSIAFIFVFQSIWGVIAARIISEGVSCAGSYILSPYRPRFHFELAKARELWKFGKWIYGQSILGYLLENGDNFFVWFTLGLPQLALYKYAYNFSNMPATHICDVISSVSFPAYSKIQDDIPRLREAYLKVLKITAFFAIPMSFLIFVLGPDFVRLFMKEHLHPMALALQILALKGLLKSSGSPRGPLYQAMGRPNIVWYLQWIRVGILAITIYPLTKMWGIEGTAISTVLVNVFVNPPALVISSKMLKCPIFEMLKPSVLPFLASVLMLIIMTTLREMLLAEMTYFSFFSLALSGIFVYLTVLYMLDRIFHHKFLDLMIEQIRMIQREKV